MEKSIVDDICIRPTCGKSWIEHFGEFCPKKNDKYNPDDEKSQEPEFIQSEETFLSQAMKQATLDRIKSFGVIPHDLDRVY